MNAPLMMAVRNRKEDPGRRKVLSGRLQAFFSSSSSSHPTSRQEKNVGVAVKKSELEFFVSFAGGGKRGCRERSKKKNTCQSWKKNTKKSLVSSLELVRIKGVRLTTKII